jgi:Dna[CI] antecedent, DciA
MKRRPMRRLGDVLAPLATELGLEGQLRLARAMAAWSRLVEEHVPAASSATWLISIEPPALVVGADAPIVAQELHLRSRELLVAFATVPGGERLVELRIVVSPGRGRRPA